MKPQSDAFRISIRFQWGMFRRQARMSFVWSKLGIFPMSQIILPRKNTNFDEFISEFLQKFSINIKFYVQNQENNSESLLFFQSKKWKHSLNVIHIAQLSVGWCSMFVSVTLAQRMEQSKSTIQLTFTTNAYTHIEPLMIRSEPQAHHYTKVSIQLSCSLENFFHRDDFSLV